MASRKLRDRLAGQDRTGAFGLAEILELARHRRNARVENVPGNATGCRRHVGGLLGIAARFVAKAAAFALT